MHSERIIYTTLFGNYEALGNPFGTFPAQCRRICFTDNPNLKSESWEIRVVEKQTLDPARESRRYKLQPEKYLPEVEWSLYVDNSISFLQPPEALFEYGKSAGGVFYCFSHPWRDCVYQEAEAVIIGEKDSEARVREQTAAYRQAGFPAKSGLYAGGVLLRKHGADNLAHLGEIWFEHVLRFSRRDQLSLPFAARAAGCPLTPFPGTLLKNEFTSWAHDKIRRVPAGFSPEIYRWLNPEADKPGVSAEAHYLANANSKTRYKHHFSALNALANKYRLNLGDMYYEAHGYARVYEQYLNAVRYKPIRVLEIGLLRPEVQLRQTPPYRNAPSLTMWCEFLPKAEVFGFDAADFSQVPPIPGLNILRGDAASKKDLTELLKKTGGKFDLIIYSAGNDAAQQQLALSILYGGLNPDGLYFLEGLGSKTQEAKTPELPETRDVLRALQCGKAMPTNYIRANALAYIQKTAAEISLYDSRSMIAPAVESDAMAIIRRAV